MIERKIVAQKLKEFQVQEFLNENLRNSGMSHSKLQRTPMGEKIIVYTSRPGMIVGRKGQNIKKLTGMIKKKFELENPQLEIAEVENINLNPKLVAERIVLSLEKYGAARFKGIVHKVMEDVMNSGALGVEVVISGKVPSTRAKSWRFSQGYMKKCGDIAQEGVFKAYGTAKLKSGVIGIKISIMPKTTKLPDRFEIKDIKDIIEMQESAAAAGQEEKTRKAAKQAEEKKESKKSKRKEKPAKESPAESAPSESADESKEEKKARKPRAKKTAKAGEEKGEEKTAGIEKLAEAAAEETAEGREDEH